MKILLVALTLNVARSYKLFTEPVPWFKAKERCNTYSGETLAKVTTKKGSDLIKLLVAKSEYSQFWIGESGSWKQNSNHWINA